MLQTASRARPTERSLAGAASTSLAAVLAGPRVPAEVLGVFPAAVYLAPASGGLVAVLTSDAVRLPPAVVVAPTAADGPFADMSSSVEAAVGAGQVIVGGLRVRVVRQWRPARPWPVPRSGAGAVPEFRAALQESGRPLPPVLATAAAALGAAPDAATAWRAADDLLGAGPGLTPAGDDVLAGYLLGRSRPLAGLAAQVAAAALHRTTALSAALLSAAARGEGADVVVGAVDAVHGYRPVGPALGQLLAVGHTSGSALAAGILAGAAVPA